MALLRVAMPTSPSWCSGVLLRLAPALAVLLLLVVVSSSTTEMVCATTTSSTTGTDWVRDCRIQGFDPEQLACSTCAVLESWATPAQLLLCQSCCTAWLGTEHALLKQPYQAAVLIDRSQGGEGEVAGFLQEEWSNVVQAKGGDRLQRVRDDSNAAARQTTGRGGILLNWGSMPQPSVLLFFDSTASMQDAGTNVKKLMATAKESIRLDGLDKSDLKDMLMALLP